MNFSNELKQNTQAVRSITNMKTNPFQNKAFQAPAKANSSFNLAPQVNSFNTIFQTKPLENFEASMVEKIVADGFQPGAISEDQVSLDVNNLKQITSEIRAIGKQGIVLMGERIHRAREILKSYKNGTFSKWLEATLGTRKTGYNLLSYYELYTALPHDSLRERFKKLPQKTAYILSSRVGNLTTKSEIINEFYDRSHQELLILIQEKLPTASDDKRKRKTLIEKVLSKIRFEAESLIVRKETLTPQNKEEIKVLKEMLSSLLVEA